LRGALATVPFLPTILSVILALLGKGSEPGILFPSLGVIQAFAVLATTAFGLTATYVVFLLFGERRKPPLACVLTLYVTAIVFASCYFALCLRFVRELPVASRNTTEVVSVGYERTDFARKLGDVSDVEMLRLRSADEEEIQNLWTYKSLAVARTLLWLSYTLTVVSFVSVFSIGVMQHAFEELRSAADSGESTLPSTSSDHHKQISREGRSE
jgi:hypothetical protein